MVLPGRPRRRRKSRLILLALILSAVVLLVNGLVSAGDSGQKRRLDQLAYLDEVRPHIEASNSQGGELVQLLEDVQGLDRAAIDRQLSRLQRDSEQLVSQVESSEPPETLRRAHHLLVATLTIRAGSVRELREAVTSALSDEAPENVEDTLGSAGDDLGTSDRTYALFVKAIPGAIRKDAQLPASEWVANPDEWSSGAMAAFVKSLRAGESTKAVHDLSIVLVKTNPESVGSDAEDPELQILPVAGSLEVTVVVANVGNESESQVTLVVGVESADGSTDEAREFIDLAPGQRRAITFKGLVLKAGQSALHVRFGPAKKETDDEDNRVTKRFVMR